MEAPVQGEAGFAQEPPRGFRDVNPGAVRRDVARRIDVAGDGATEPGAALGAVTSVRISGAAMAGSVSDFALSPGGTTAVYIADQDTLGIFEIYSVPVDGSGAPARLTSGLAFGAGDEGVSAFRISSDGTRVVFLADPNLGGGQDELFSAPIDASATAVRLNVGTEAPVTAFGIAPDGLRVGYFGAGPTGRVELFSATIGGAGSGVRLTDIAGGNALGDVVAADFSPDSSRVVFAADPATNDVFQWLSVSISAGAPGSEVQLSDALSLVSQGAISPDSTTLVYTGDDDVASVMDLFSVPIAGGTAVRLNPPHGGNGVVALRVSPDSTRVAYIADQVTLGVSELFGAQIDVLSSGIRLNTPLAPPQSVATVTISPDSTTVVYEADENIPGTTDVLSVPIDGSAPPATLHALTPPDNAGFFSTIGVPAVGSRAVYPVIGSAVEIFSTPFTAGASSQRVNDPLAAGQTLFNAFVPTAASRLMAFGMGTIADGIASRVYAAAVRSDLASEQVNVTAVSTALGALRFEIGADESYAVYLQDQTTLGKPELFSRALDSDGDDVVNPQDNCPFVDNPTQAPVVFGQTVLAESEARFAWGEESEVRWARGALATVSSYTPDSSGTLADAIAFTDDATPGPDAGFYYLFAPDCTGRSYQTVSGAEPARDAGSLP
jgi:Tol biopolymer transport system component